METIHQIKKTIERARRFLMRPVERFRDARGYSRFVRECPLKIKDTDKTLDFILSHHCGVSRYGDGEIAVMLGGENGFQTSDRQLAARLREVLSSDLPNHIVCLPMAFRTVSHMTRPASAFWRNYIRMRGTSIEALTSLDKEYYDASFTRFYMDYADKSGSGARIEKIKRIWSGRAVYIVEGRGTGLGVGNDLLDGASSVHRILCPSRDAWSLYDEILETVRRLVPRDTLVLCALGMTATVLAYDLSREGYQAIDIGHVDIEYEWYMEGATAKCAVKGKSVNEVGQTGDIAILHDEAYTRSVIATIG